MPHCLTTSRLFFPSLDDGDHSLLMATFDDVLKSFQILYLEVFMIAVIEYSAFAWCGMCDSMHSTKAGGGGRGEFTAGCNHLLGLE